MFVLPALLLPALVIGLIDAIAPGLAFSVNHMLPSAPGTITRGPLTGVAVSVIVAGLEGANTVTLLPACSVNQSVPFGPAAIAFG